MFEKIATEKTEEKYVCSKREIKSLEAIGYEKGFKDGAEFGYNSAIEWFDARTNIPLPKQLGIYRYTIEAISDKGDIVCYDYKDKCWKKLIIENEKVTYIPVEIKMWYNKLTKEGE